MGNLVPRLREHAFSLFTIFEISISCNTSAHMLWVTRYALENSPCLSCDTSLMQKNNLIFSPDGNVFVLVARSTLEEPSMITYPDG